MLLISNILKLRMGTNNLYIAWALKAQCQKIDAFKLWCWSRLWKVPWTTRKSNQSILKEINPEYSLEGLMLKLKLHLMGRTDSLEKTLKLGLKAGGDGHDRGWDDWMASPTQWTWVWASLRRWWRTGKPGVLQSWGCKELDTTERLNWTELLWDTVNAVQTILTKTRVSVAQEE